MVATWFDLRTGATDAHAKEGLAAACAITENRLKVVRKLKASGKTVMGYMCIYPVLEMMTALDMVPCRIFGSMSESVSSANACLPTVVCPFLRSAMDLGLKHEYDFLDGVVMCHSCEVGEKLSHIWRTYLPSGYFHFIDVPHTIRHTALAYFKEQLKNFQHSLESFAGRQMTAIRLKEAIELHNHQRALVKHLYGLTKPDPLLVSGTEIFQALTALTCIGVEEGNHLLEAIVGQVKTRQQRPPKQAARLLVWGSILDDTTLIEMIETTGAHIVLDDTCVGSRAYFSDVQVTDDPLDGLAYRYLVEIKCPRTFRADMPERGRKNNLADLESRFGYLKNYIREWKVDGVVMQSMRYCDIHGYEVPGIKQYLDSISVPSIYLEHDYSKGALAPLKTRVQGFLEVLASREHKGD